MFTAPGQPIRRSADDVRTDIAKIRERQAEGKLDPVSAAQQVQRLMVEIERIEKARPRVALT